MLHRHANPADGQRLVGAGGPGQRDEQQQGDGRGAHQNELRLSTLAIEIVKTPT